MRLTRILMVLVACTLLVAGVSCGSSGSTTYQLTTAIEGQGSVSPSSGTYASGEEVTLTALPASGWEFDHWGGAISGSDNPISIRIHSNKVIEAYFIIEPTPTPIPTPISTPTSTVTPTPTPTSTPTPEEAPYNSVRDTIQDAVTAYIADHMGFFPVQIGYIDGKSMSIIFMARLIVEYHYLQEVPDGCYQAPGESDDNCDDFNAAYGVLGCSVYNHYIWGVDGDGAVYSRCVGNDCLSNTADGYQGVWP